MLRKIRFRLGSWLLKPFNPDRWTRFLNESHKTTDELVRFCQENHEADHTVRPYDGIHQLPSEIDILDPIQKCEVRVFQELLIGYLREHGNRWALVNSKSFICWILAHRVREAFEERMREESSYGGDYWVPWACVDHHNVTYMAYQRATGDAFGYVHDGFSYLLGNGFSRLEKDQDGTEWIGITEEFIQRLYKTGVTSGITS